MNSTVKSNVLQLALAALIALLVSLFCAIPAAHAQDHLDLQASSIGGEASFDQVICRYEFSSSGSLTKFELGTWSRDYAGNSTWSAYPSSAYSVVGYVDSRVYDIAADVDGLDAVKWTSGKPSGHGKFVVKVTASGASGLSGAGYFYVENADAYDLSEAHAEVVKAACGGVTGVKLGIESQSFPLEYPEWTWFNTSEYQVKGYCTVDAFKSAGFAKSAKWASGLPTAQGDYVIRVDASSKSKTYYGTCYVRAEVGETSHVNSGDWVVERKATYTKTGVSAHYCKYCGAKTATAKIPKLTGAKKGTTAVAGTGAAKGKYKVLSDWAVSYVAPSSKTAKSVTVPTSVTINGREYAVTAVAAKAFSGCTALATAKLNAEFLESIGKSAFSKCTKLSTITLKSTVLTKAGVKGSLSGSNVKTVKAPKASVADYKTYFTASNCGKAVTVS